MNLLEQNLVWGFRCLAPRWHFSKCFSGCLERRCLPCSAAQRSTRFQVKIYVPGEFWAVTPAGGGRAEAWDPCRRREWELHLPPQGKRPGAGRFSAEAGPWHCETSTRFGGQEKAGTGGAGALQGRERLGFFFGSSSLHGQAHCSARTEQSP